jgi:hypothetical protein
MRYLALAASSLLIAVGAVFWLGRTAPVMVASLEQLTGDGKPLPSAIVHQLVRTRSTSFDVETPLPPPGQAVELQVLPEYEAQPTRCRIALVKIDNDDRQSVGSVSGLDT